jgi:hypothetical protein
MRTRTGLRAMMRKRMRVRTEVRMKRFQVFIRVRLTNNCIRRKGKETEQWEDKSSYTHNFHIPCQDTKLADHKPLALDELTY